jgi:hypothetical protein
MREARVTLKPLLVLLARFSADSPKWCRTVEGLSSRKVVARVSRTPWHQALSAPAPPCRRELTHRMKAQ